MPPKSTKNTNTVTSTPSVDTIKQEWLAVVKDITEVSDKLEHLCKRRDELVSQLWNHLNKDPASTVVDGEDKVPEKPPTKPPSKSTKKAAPAPTPAEEDTPVPPPVKASAKKNAKSTVVQPDEPVDAPVAPPKKKTTKSTPVKTGDEDEKPLAKTLAKAPAKGAAKKVTAPSKGTPKPKLDVDSEDVNQNEEPTSEDTDLDSLSSVSSDSEVSGGDEN